MSRYTEVAQKISIRGDIKKSSPTPSLNQKIEGARSTKKCRQSIVNLQASCLRVYSLRKRWFRSRMACFIFYSNEYGTPQEDKLMGGHRNKSPPKAWTKFLTNYFLSQMICCHVGLLHGIYIGMLGTLIMRDV